MLKEMLVFLLVKVTVLAIAGASLAYTAPAFDNLNYGELEIQELFDDYDFLILTPEQFADALKPLAIHKNDTGMPTRILTLESIDDSYTGYDMPEKIKLAIAYHQESYGVKYVMLVGDTDKFPVRYIRGINTEWGTRYYPSDLYYADLYDEFGSFDDWDFDGDGFFGTTDFSGGQDTAKVNVDRIDLKPDVAVGRVLASTVAEVENYVNKVISYEFTAWRSNWARNALVISDHDTSGAFSDSTSANAIVDSLMDFQVSEMFLKDSPYNNMDAGERGTAVADFINQGMGFVAHMGHGDTRSWAHVFGTGDMSKLTNQERLPIAYTIGCLTATFHFGHAWQPDWNRAEERYLTVDGNEFDGRKLYKATRPMPADLQPEKYDVESLAEEILVKHKTGAVAYIGTAAKGEHGGKALLKYFVENLNDNTYNPKLGLMWMNAMRTFADNEAQPGMGDYYGYIHQHKTMLFGDPSLRVGGVSRVQKSDFLGEWEMVHDGWKGTLNLSALADNPIDSYYNIEGTYTDMHGGVREVMGAVQTPNYLRGESWPDNMIILKIDFNGNFDFEDEQSITAYKFSWDKDEMAGITSWGGMPFGVSIYRKGKVKFDGILDGIKVTPAHLTGAYKMNHDGWQGTLKLHFQYGASIEGMPEIVGEYIGGDGKTHKAYGSYEKSLPHILTLFVDFNDTIWEDDDTKFDLYFFTQTKDGMAGITYWKNRPFGVRLQRISSLDIRNLSGARSQEHHYTIQVPASAPSVVFEMSGNRGDADLYVKYGAKPTASTWDQRRHIVGSNETVKITNPKAGVYHVMVHGYADFQGVQLRSRILD